MIIVMEEQMYIGGNSRMFFSVVLAMINIS